jgi:hypothetical protein
VVACLLSCPGAGVGGGERAEDLFRLPGHIRVRGAVFLLQDRYDSVGGEVKIAVRVGVWRGCSNPAKVCQNAESMSSAS